MKERIEVHRMTVQGMEFITTIVISESLTNKGLKPCGYQITDISVNGMPVKESDLPLDIVTEIHENIAQ